MFIKPFPKYNSTTKKRYTIYRLCESYRLDGRIRHRTIVGLGKLDKLPGVEQKKYLAKRIEEIIKFGTGLLIKEPLNKQLEHLALYFYQEIKKKRRYNISHNLYSVKDKLEQYLSKRTNELFDLEDKIILYDLTNTYFEGRMLDSKTAKYGRSKEKRKDAKLIVLAVVINREGFLKYTNIFEGNMTDSKTLETIVEALSKRTLFIRRKPIVVMDAGISTDDNLKMLKSKGYAYMCVSRSNLKEYYADTDSLAVQIKDKRKQPIELMKGSTRKGEPKNPIKCLKE